MLTCSYVNVAITETHAEATECSEKAEGDEAAATSEFHVQYQCQ